MKYHVVDINKKTLHRTKSKLKKLKKRGFNTVDIKSNPFFDFFLWIADRPDKPFSKSANSRQFNICFAFEYKRPEVSDFPLCVAFRIRDKTSKKEEKCWKIEFDSIEGADTEFTELPYEEISSNGMPIRENTNNSRSFEVFAKPTYNQHYCAELKIQV